MSDWDGPELSLRSVPVNGRCPQRRAADADTPCRPSSRLISHRCSLLPVPHVIPLCWGRSCLLGPVSCQSCVLGWGRSLVSLVCWTGAYLLSILCLLSVLCAGLGPVSCQSWVLGPVCCQPCVLGLVYCQPCVLGPVYCQPCVLRPVSCQSCVLGPVPCQYCLLGPGLFFRRPMPSLNLMVCTSSL